MGRTILHTPLMTVKLYLGGEAVEADVDTEASASVLGKRLACKFRILKRERKVKVRHRYRSSLEGNYVVNTSFKLMDSSFILDKFAMHAQVFDIGNRDVILDLSWLTENGCLVDTQNRCLKNANTSQVIPCSVRWIPKVLIIEEEPLEDSGILLIIDASERYSCYAKCFSVKQAARLLEHKS